MLPKHARVFRHCPHVRVATVGRVPPRKIDICVIHLHKHSFPQLQDLLAAVDAGEWETLARRRVKHFGYEFRYLTRNVDPGCPIAPMPEAVARLLPRMQVSRQERGNV